MIKLKKDDTRPPAAQKGGPAMAGTKKLYYKDAYLREFCARVLSCTPCADGMFNVVLDETAFYPEVGGQPAHLGALGAARVMDVQLQGEAVVHRTTAPLRVGETVQGNIDWARRFDHMQQHTGEHITSGIIKSRFGFDNLGFHMGRESVVLECSGQLDAAQLEELELAVNEAICRNGEVRAWFPRPDELAGLTYRRKKEIEGDVRIVDAAGADVCACCGTHVARAGEVQLAKFTGVTRHKGHTVIEALFGARALTDYFKKHKALMQLSAFYSAPPLQVPQRAQAERAAWEQSALAAAQVQQALFEAEAKLCPPGTPAVRFCEGLSPDGARRYACALAEVCPAALVFGGSEGAYACALASRTADMRPLGAALAGALNGKGGGKPALWQGRAACTRAAAESGAERIFAEAGL